MGRNLRNRLNLIKPEINRQVQDKQMKIAIKPTKETLRQCTEGETVAARDYRRPNKWTSGLVTKREGPLNYQVEVSPNSIWKRHADQIRNSDLNDKQREEIINDKTVEIEINPDEPTEQPQDLQQKQQDNELPLSEPIQRRYPLRTRKVYSMGSNTNTGMQYIYSAPTNIDSCIGTCENGGTWSTDMCACDCTPGYTGNLCTSQCSTQCNNGAAVNEFNCECICNEKQFRSKCNCRYPFTGGNCNTCKHVTCENNGVFNAVSCRCECLPGYGGLRCDVTCADTGDNATCTAEAAAGNCISDNVNMEQTCMVSCNVCVEQSPSAVPSTTTSSGSNFRNYDLEIIIILIPVALMFGKS